MERRRLESTAATYAHLRGVLAIPAGLLFILAALGNWQVGPFRHDWVFLACLLAIGGGLPADRPRLPASTTAA